MISLIVILVVLALVYYCLTLLPIPEPFGVIIKVVFVLVAILEILSAFGIFHGSPVLV